jgi:hypothetical protein
VFLNFPPICNVMHGLDWSTLCWLLRFVLYDSQIEFCCYEKKKETNIE